MAGAAVVDQFLDDGRRSWRSPAADRRSSATTPSSTSPWTCNVVERVYTPAVAAAFLRGSNPLLDHRAPMLLIADNRLPRSRRRSSPPPKRCSGRDPAPGGDTAAASSRGAGVLRLHYAPAALPAAQGQVGPTGSMTRVPTAWSATSCGTPPARCGAACLGRSTGCGPTRRQPSGRTASTTPPTRTTNPTRPLLLGRPCRSSCEIATWAG